MGNKGLRYAFRDGFVNLRRHPMILLASISTMFLMLLLLGSFIIFSLNASSLLKQAGEQPPVEIQFKVGTAQDIVQELDRQLGENELIVEHKMLSPEENMVQFKERIGKSEFFDEFDYKQHIPWTILVRLSDPSLCSSFKQEIMKYPGVYDVMMETQLLSVLQSAIQKVGIGSLILFPILCLITVLIMSNMVRMIALSRATELSIMKTMGATNRYIRIPFVIEGLFVATVSSALSLLTLFVLYRAFLNRFDTGNGGLHFLSMAYIAVPLLVVVIAAAYLIAGMTSALSVKKHIKV